MTRGGQLLREIAEAAGTIRALGERGIELQQRALEQAELRRDLAIRQHLERTPHERQHLIERRLLRRRGCALLAAILEAARADEILVGDELVAIPLHDQAGERPAADHEDLLVVLFEFLDQADEVTVAANDDVGVDVTVRERHLEGVERQVDVGAVLVAARSEVALDEFGRVLRQRPAVIAGARPVAVGDLGHHVAPFLERLEDDPDVELHAQRALDPDLDVVEVDENCNLQSCICQNPKIFPSGTKPYLYYGPNPRGAVATSRERRKRRCCPDPSGKASRQRRPGGSKWADGPS